MVPAIVVAQKGGKSVINLSKHFQLTGAQLSVLDRGLNFIPTKGSNKVNTRDQIRSDVQQYHRRLKLAVYFEHKPGSAKLPFTCKSQWVPPKSGLPQAVFSVVDADIQFFRTAFNIDWVRDNLSVEEFEALFSLQKIITLSLNPRTRAVRSLS